MGRHTTVSSPLRSPAVLVGVPVATVLATWSTTAVLGGVVPSAEEAPLRAEAPGDIVTGTEALTALTPAGSPEAPAVSLDAPLQETVVATTAARSAPPAQSERFTGPTVVDVPAAAGPRLVDAAPAAVAPARSAAPRIVDGGRADDGATSTVASGVRRASGAVGDAPVPPTRRAAAATSPVETASPRASDDASDVASDVMERTDERAPVVDLDTPSDGLSVLSFG